MAKIDQRIIIIGAFLLLVVLVFLAPNLMRKPSSYSAANIDIYSSDSQFPVPETVMAPQEMMAQPQMMAQQPMMEPEPMPSPKAKAQAMLDDPIPMGVSTSMLPRDIPSTEDFGAFSPDAILQGQNYLDPRAQIGYPETLGGNIRNPNYDIRSEPVNPRVPVSIWNNSTIVPDLMRPQFEIGR
jgi:hypothetical protein